MSDAWTWTSKSPLRGIVWHRERVGGVLIVFPDFVCSWRWLSSGVPLRVAAEWCRPPRDVTSITSSPTLAPTSQSHLKTDHSSSLHELSAAEIRVLSPLARVIASVTSYCVAFHSATQNSTATPRTWSLASVRTLFQVML